MKTLKITIAIIFICFFMVQCSKDEDSGTHVAPKIEWIPGSTSTTYTYSGGVVTGYFFSTSFEVLNNSGEICIEARNEGGNGESCNTIYYVEKGKQYTVNVKGTRTNARLATIGESCMEIVFCSLNCAQNCEIAVDPYLVPGDNEFIEDIYYCPQSIDMSDIELVERE